MRGEEGKGREEMERAGAGVDDGVGDWEIRPEREAGTGVNP